MRKKAQISCAVTAQLISAFIFDTHTCTCSSIPQFINPKFQASHLPWLCSPVCIRPGRKPGNRLSHDAAHIVSLPSLRQDFALVPQNTYRCLILNTGCLSFIFKIIPQPLRSFSAPVFGQVDMGANLPCHHVK